MPYKSVFRAMFCTLALALAGICHAGAASPEEAPFADFTGADGALTVFPHGDFVEPYSAIKALLIAHRLGVNVHAPAAVFADWILPFQQANGPFPRICRSNGDRWLACGPSDADDSLSVLWCALGAEVLPEKRSMDASCERALENLATQWDPQRQSFRAMFGGQATYFADNVEVMMYLKRLRANPRFFMRHLDGLAKLPTEDAMDAALTRNYGYRPGRGPGQALEPQAASMPSTPYAFYPYGVAPLYPMMYDLRTGQARRGDWIQWREKYGRQWLAGKVDHFPWGLAAWAAYKAGDDASARAWLNRSAQWKADRRWNIMEEGVQIGLKEALPRAKPVLSQADRHERRSEKINN